MSRPGPRDRTRGAPVSAARTNAEPAPRSAPAPATSARGRPPSAARGGPAGARPDRGARPSAETVADDDEDGDAADGEDDDINAFADEAFGDGKEEVADTKEPAAAAATAESSSAALDVYSATKGGDANVVFDVGAWRVSAPEHSFDALIAGAGLDANEATRAWLAAATHLALPLAVEAVIPGVRYESGSLSHFMKQDIGLNEYLANRQSALLQHTDRSRVVPAAVKLTLRAAFPDAAHDRAILSLVAAYVTDPFPFPAFVPTGELMVETSETEMILRARAIAGSMWMHVKHPGCFRLATVFSHANTETRCTACDTQLTRLSTTSKRGRVRVIEGCAYRVIAFTDEQKAAAREYARQKARLDGTAKNDDEEDDAQEKAARRPPASDSETDDGKGSDSDDDADYCAPVRAQPVDADRGGDEPARGPAAPPRTRGAPPGRGRGASWGGRGRRD